MYGRACLVANQGKYQLHFFRCNSSAYVAHLYAVSLCTFAEFNLWPICNQFPSLDVATVFEVLVLRSGLMHAECRLNGTRSDLTPTKQLAKGW